MSRRADPENIYLARRAAVLSILTTSGVSADRAEQLVRQWEANAQAAGIPRLEATFWDGASGWTIGRAYPNSARASPGLEAPDEPEISTVATRSRTQRQGRVDAMIDGVHAIVFSPAADEVRAFFRDTLGLAHVDAGASWMIFALPPAELAVRPAERPGHEIYLMTVDLDGTVAALAERGVALARPIPEQTWGRVTAIALAGSTEIGLYEPRHPRPTNPAARITDPEVNGRGGTLPEA